MRRASKFPPKWYPLRAFDAQDHIRLDALAKGAVCFPSLPPFHCFPIFYGTLLSAYIISRHTIFVKGFAFPLSPARCFSALLLRTIQSADDSLHRGKFDICIRCSAKERRARGYLDLDIGYSTCLGSLLKRVLRIREHLKIGYIPLIERLHKSINGAVTMTGQLAHDTINGDAGCTCNSL